MRSAPNSRGTSGAGCVQAGGSPLMALTGKLAPLFAVFILLMVVLLVPIPQRLSHSLPGR